MDKIKIKNHWQWDFKEYEEVGNLIFIKELPRHIQKCGSIRRVGLFKCKLCEKEFSKRIDKTIFKTKSCGCATTNGKLIQKHGLRNHPLYNVWRGILKRCYNKNNPNYKNYGGRGIKVCDEWLYMENFFKDMLYGYSKGLQLDRINNNGDYSKENCRWSTPKENTNNKRNNRYITYNDETKTFTQWCDILGLKIGTLKNRLDKWKWSIEKALFTPINRKK